MMIQSLDDGLVGLHLLYFSFFLYGLISYKKNYGIFEKLGARNYGLKLIIEKKSSHTGSTILKN